MPLFGATTRNSATVVTAKVSARGFNSLPLAARTLQCLNRLSRVQSATLISGCTDSQSDISETSGGVALDSRDRKHATYRDSGRTG
jgi:hypothetical protein